MNIPIATNENIVTDRTTDGENPATKAKHHRTKIIVTTLKMRKRFVLGRKFKR